MASVNWGATHLFVFSNMCFSRNITWIPQIYTACPLECRQIQSLLLRGSARDLIHDQTQNQTVNTIIMVTWIPWPLAKSQVVNSLGTKPWSPGSLNHESKTCPVPDLHSGLLALLLGARTLLGAPGIATSLLLVTRSY